MACVESARTSAGAPYCAEPSCRGADPIIASLRERGDAPARSAAQAAVRVERALARCREIEHRQRVVAGAEAHRIAPWGMDRACGKIRELRYPASHVGAVRIETLALRDRVEHAEIRRGVDAGTGRPLPALGVVAEIGIDERVPEPA